MGRFVGAAYSPAAPTNAPRIKTCSPFFYLVTLTSTREKKIGKLWAPPKNCSKRGEGFGLKFFGRDVVEGKKMLFHTFLKVLMVG